MITFQMMNNVNIWRIENGWIISISIIMFMKSMRNTISIFDER